METPLIYSVVVPVYQGEATIEALFLKIKAFFETRKESFEVVFISDGAVDNSWKKIQELKRAYPQFVKGVQLNRNFGQHNATLCGIAEAQGAFILTMDEDLQHDPQEIAKLIREQKAGNYDVVYGNYTHPKHSWFRNLASRLLRKLLEKALPDLFVGYSSFRLMKQELAKAALDMHHPYPFLDIYLGWLSTSFSATLVEHYPRKTGKSAYTLQKLIQHSLHILFNFSNLPLRVFSYFSFLLFIVSTGYALYIFFRKIIYNDLVTGFATIAIFLGLGFGLVFLGIGLLGEYIQHINLKSTQKPSYMVKEKL